MSEQSYEHVQMSAPRWRAVAGGGSGGMGTHGHGQSTAQSSHPVHGQSISKKCRKLVPKKFFLPHLVILSAVVAPHLCPSSDISWTLRNPVSRWALHLYNPIVTNRTLNWAPVWKQPCYYSSPPDLYFSHTHFNSNWTKLYFVYWLIFLLYIYR